MIRELSLEPANENLEPGGTLIWDDETGELNGYRAVEVQKEARLVREEGSVGFTPLGLYSESDPLKAPKAMAIMLMRMNYRLPEQLEKFIEVADRDIEGALY